MTLQARGTQASSAGQLTRLDIAGNCWGRVRPVTRPVALSKQHVLPSCGQRRSPTLTCAVHTTKEGSTSAQEAVQDSAKRTLDTLDIFLRVAESTAADSSNGGAESASSTAHSAPATQTPQEHDPGSSVSATQLSTPDSLEPRIDTEKDAFWQLTKGYVSNWVREQIEGQLKKPDLGLQENGLPKVRPRLAYVMLAGNLGLYGLGLAVGLAQGRQASEDYFLALATLNDEIQHGEYYRLVTSTFVHDSFMHLVLNCSALFAIAPQIEAVLGSRTFTAVYLLSGLSGSVACFLFSDTITVGASSAIFGLLGAMGGYLWKNREAVEGTDQLMRIAGIAAINLALASRGDTQIDNLGHAGGLIAGLCLGLGMAPQYMLPTAADKDATSDGKANSDGATSPEALSTASTSNAPLATTSAKVQDADQDAQSATPVDKTGLVKRWSVCLTYASTLAAITASAIVSRSGDLPLPKGLSLDLDFDLLELFL